jgi:hypothetical protein
MDKVASVVLRVKEMATKAKDVAEQHATTAGTEPKYA